MWGYSMKSLEELNNKRIECAINLEEPDQIPFNLSIASNWACHLAGVSTYEYYHDPMVMLNVKLKARNALNNLAFSKIEPDPGCFYLVPRALGAEIWYPRPPESSPYNDPWVKPGTVKSLEDVDKLEVPDPWDVDLVRKTFDYYEIMRNKAGDIITLGGWTLGPFDVAALLRGPTQFFVDLYRNPKMSHKLLKKIMESTIAISEAEERVAGTTYESFAVADDLPGYLPPLLFREFVMPYTKRIFSKFGRSGLNTWHSDADKADAIAHLLSEMDVRVFDRFHPSIDIEKLKNKVGNELCLVGNLEPLLVLKGQTSEVFSMARKLITKAGPEGGYILCTGGEVDYEAPIDNLFSMVKASQEYGKYPFKNG